MTSSFSDDATFTLADGLEISEVPDGRVIYQAAKERVHYFNPTAIVVFELCGLGHNLGEIGVFLRDAYDLDAIPAEQVHDCVKALVGEDLLRPSSP